MSKFDITDAYIQALMEEKAKSQYDKNQFIEAKKYNSPVFHIYDVNGNKFEFKCLYYEVTNSNQASLWGHEVELRHNEKLVSNAKISYYNRTWESFEFQSCMLEALRNYMAIIANELYSNYKETNNISKIKTDQKTEILNQDETYKTLQKLYDLISSGNKGELTESYNQDKIKTESISTDGNIAETFENYPAFKANFDDIIIKKSPYDKQYYIFKKDAESESDYIYYAKNKDIIEGWLYGAVMAKNNRM